MNKVQEYIYNLLPPVKRRGDWLCFNCPSCCRFGEKRPDQKHRGGIRFDSDGIVYNCFNCRFTWGWSPSFHMSRKMSMFLQDMGLTASQLMDVRKLIDEYLDSETVKKEKSKPRIIRDIPEEYKSIKQSLYEGIKSPTLAKVYSYISSRNERLLSWEDLMWAEGRNNFLIPCREFDKIVGYSLRSLDDNSDSKYIHYIPNGYLYNFDNLLKNRKYQIIVEGQTDALSINGIALLSNVFTPEKLKRLMDYKGDSEIIILPDRDSAGMKIVEQVINEKLPFSVSFPNWDRGIKDAEDAVKKYGRLYTIYTIINSKESDPMKIKMKEKGWLK